MKGSEKQIKWAENIKASALEQINRMKELRKYYDEIDGKRNSNLYQTTWEGIEAVEADIKKAFEICDNASDLIDNREYFSPEFILKLAKEKSK